MICRSVRQTPQAATSINTWPAPGSGSATVRGGEASGRLRMSARIATPASGRGGRTPRRLRLPSQPPPRAGQPPRAVERRSGTAATWSNGDTASSHVGALRRPPTRSHRNAAPTSANAAPPPTSRPDGEKQRPDAEEAERDRNAVRSRARRSRRNRGRRAGSRPPSTPATRSAGQAPCSRRRRQQGEPASHPRRPTGKANIVSRRPLASSSCIALTLLVAKSATTSAKRTK